MLEGLRKAQQNWIGKIVISILFGLLIISFGIWGVSGFIGGGQQTTIAKVGKTEVSITQLQAAFRRQTQQLERMLQKPVSPREAVAMNLDMQVLSQLVSEAVLDESARKMGLAASDEMVRQSIFSLPAFQTNGNFNRSLFDTYLRNSEIYESDFIREQRNVLARSQIATAMSSEMKAPLAMQEISFRLANERRDISYFILGEKNVQAAAEPTNEQLETAFQDNKAQFKAPEYRSFEALAINPADIVKPDSISDEDAQKYYEEFRDTRYASGERRTIQQIPYSSDEDAQAAFDKLQAKSATFEALAAERKIDAAALTIGNLTRQEIIDPAIADAAFAAAQNTVLPPVKGRFGTVLIRVTAIDKSGHKDFAGVKDEIKQQVAQDRAKSRIETLRDDIDDMWINARPLTEIAKEKNIPLINVSSVSRSGLDMQDKPVTGLPEAEKLVQAVFASDIGVDNDTLRTNDGGYIWYQVTNVTPSRDRTLDEVRNQVISIWKQNAIADQLSELAAKYVEQIKTPADLKKVAGDMKLEVKTASKVSRADRAQATDMGAQGLTRIFATPVEKAASVANGTNRIVFLVTSATVPAFNADDDQTKLLNNQLAGSVSYDLLIEYISKLQKEYGATVYQQLARRTLVGGEQP